MSAILTAVHVAVVRLRLRHRLSLLSFMLLLPFGLVVCYCGVFLKRQRQYRGPTAHQLSAPAAPTSTPAKLHPQLQRRTYPEKGTSKSRCLALRQFPLTPRRLFQLSMTNMPRPC